MQPKTAGLASLFKAFGHHDEYDPFLDEDPVIQDSRIGMETLLSMCSIVEINSLCGALGLVEPCSRMEKTRKVEYTKYSVQ